MSRSTEPGAEPQLPWDDTPQDLYDEAPCGYLSTLPDGTIVNVNRTFLTWTGYERGDLVGRRRFAELLSGGGRIYHETHLAPLLRMQGRVQGVALDVVCANGRRLPTLVNSVLGYDADGGPRVIRTTVFDATDRRRYETELLRARRAAEESEQRVRVLQQIVADLAAAATETEVAQAIAGAPEAAFGAADSAIWVVDRAGGRLRLAASSGELADAADVPLDSPLVPAEVVRRAEVVIPGDPEQFPDLAAALRRRGRQGALLLPLIGRGVVLGVLAGTFTEPRSFADGEVRLASLLGLQAGQALDRARSYDEARRLAAENARLYEQQREIAQTLQRSLLAGEPPADRRFAVETHYRAGARGMTVGGDWWDAFPIGTDKLAVVVGDVVGRGVHAASAMGQLRSAIRALASAEAGPARLVERLDTFVERLPSGRMATVAYGELTLSTGELVFCCAGHLPPLLLPADGTPKLLWGGRSAPLGSRAGRTARSEDTVRLPAGARLLLYTDGLVERRDRPLDDGFELLATAFGERRGAPLKGLTAALADAMLDGEPPDDVCLLCLSYGTEPELHRTIRTDPNLIAALRQDLRGWLTAHEVDEEARYAVVLACSEAVANAIEHGYGGAPDGVVRVTARMADEAVELLVRDEGAWREPHPDPVRGRGLAMIRRVMQDVAVDIGAGTTVTMRRRTAPA